MHGKAWDLRKEVFNLEGSYDKNKAKFHVTHSLPSWLRKKRAHVDDSSPKVATIKGHGWKKKPAHIKQRSARGPVGCVER